MKILIFTDNHFCETSSIVRKFGTKYTVRLENQIESLNWVEDMALKLKVDWVICAGDFFDKPTLTDMELTALRDIRWQTQIQHAFLVGNHESSVNGLRFNSVKSLERKPDMTVVPEPVKLCFPDEGFDLCFLPYVIESDRKSMKEYFGAPTGRKRIIVSHNDIKGLQMGAIVSQTGFEIADFEENADIVVNGHLHNGQKVSGKVVNLGNLTGQNFSEDAARYSHNIMILDTDTLKYELIENPYAFNFYKLAIGSEKDIRQLDELKPNAVLAIKCPALIVESIKDAVAANKKVIESKITTVHDAVDGGIASTEELIKIDNHLEKFKEFVLSRGDEEFSDRDMLKSELAEVCE